jgi:hypothetical protein
VTDNGHVAFWLGTLKPTAEVLARSYRLLGGRSPDRVFPVNSRSVVEITTSDMAGEIRGFMYLAKEKSGLFKRKQVVRFIVE